MNKEELLYIIRGIDQGATKLTKEVTADIEKLGRQATSSAGLVGRLSGALSGLGGWIKAGFGIGLGLQLQRFVSEGLGSLVNGFFDAIHAGAEWAQTIKDIERVTGMSAEASSTWAAVMERVGVPLDNVERTLAMFGRNLAENEELFVKLGIATRETSGQFLDANTILTNTRRAFAAQGEALANTGAAQELFSRSGYKMLEVLQLTDAQFDAYARDAAKAGQVIGDDLTGAVERFHREQNKLGGVIQGLQAQIFGALGPTLEHFVDSFANFIQANLSSIVQFVVNVANFIGGVIGGLFGIDFSATTAEQAIDALGQTTTKTGQAFDGLSASTKKAATGEDAITTSITAQIKAIDAQIKAIERHSDARHAAAQRAQLDLSLANARAQLADLKGNAPFTEGLSNAEAVLARQKHAQDIIDAEKAVTDATGALSMFEADQSDHAARTRLENKKRSLTDELAAHKKTITAQAAGQDWLTGVNLKNNATISAAATNLYKGITKQAEKWRDDGVKFSNDLKTAVKGVTDALLGVETTSYQGSTLVSKRSGGLVGALAVLGDIMRVTADLVARAVGLISSALGPLLQVLPKTLPNTETPSNPTGTSLWDLISSFALFRGRPPSAHGNATGGHVNAGELIRIGEIGPEYWRPDVPGTVIPSSVTDRPGGDVRPVVVQVQVSGRTLFEIIDERLLTKADNAPVGMQAFRGSSS